MLQELTAARLCTSMPHSREIPALRQTALDRARWFVFEHFELVLVLLLVSSILAIHWFIDEKIAFLNFYYPSSPPASISDGGALYGHRCSSLFSSRFSRRLSD